MVPVGTLNKEWIGQELQKWSQLLRRNGDGIACISVCCAAKYSSIGQGFPVRPECSLEANVYIK
jgi:hypothetical protein